MSEHPNETPLLEAQIAEYLQPQKQLFPVTVMPGILVNNIRAVAEIQNPALKRKLKYQYGWYLNCWLEDYFAELEAFITVKTGATKYTPKHCPRKVVDYLPRINSRLKAYPPADTIIDQYNAITCKGIDTASPLHGIMTALNDNDHTQAITACQQWQTSLTELHTTLLDLLVINRNQRREASNLLFENAFKDDGFSEDDTIDRIMNFLDGMYWYDRDLVLYYIEYSSYRELSELTGIAHQSIWKTCQNVFKKIREHLQENGFKISPLQSKEPTQV